MHLDATSPGLGPALARQTTKIPGEPHRGCQFGYTDPPDGNPYAARLATTRKSTDPVSDPADADAARLQSILGEPSTCAFTLSVGHFSSGPLALEWPGAVNLALVPPASRAGGAKLSSPFGDHLTCAETVLHCLYRRRAIAPRPVAVRELASLRGVTRKR